MMRTMEHREKILSQLYSILDKNTNDVRIYYRLADRCKRTSLKNFFKKLSYQKRIFCRRIRFEIKELETDTGYIDKLDFQQKLSIAATGHNLPSFRADVLGLIKYCYKREQEYLELYKTLLAKTHLGNIREMLINQKHSVQLVINEIKSLESKTHQGKNEGEVNYS